VTAEENFWSWFTANEPRLFYFESGPVSDDMERLFDEVAHELQKVDPDLSFEFGPRGTKREFVISASGIKSAFPAVVRLAKAAPPLERWQIIAFRPRRMPIHGVQIGEVRIDPDQVQFSLLDNGKNAGIYLFIPGFTEGDVARQQIGYLFLDEALGEYDVECRLGLIEMHSPNTDTSAMGDRHSLEELPKQFDRLTAHLEGRSGEPS
jgi:hypothetical protein